ncbi:unnamed protein product [Ixodes persulcatus]
MNPAGIKTASSKQLQAPLQAESAELSLDRTVKSPSPSTTWFRTAYRYTQPSDPASSPGEQTVPLLLTPSRRLLSHAPSSANPSAPTGGEAGGGDGSSASAAVITAQRTEPKLEAAQRQQLIRLEQSAKHPASQRVAANGHSHDETRVSCPLPHRVCALCR